MTALNCDSCGEYIETSNRHFVGFCSPECRDVDRARRDAVASDLAQRRAVAREHRRATERHRNPLYPT